MRHPQKATTMETTAMMLEVKQACRGSVRYGTVESFRFATPGRKNIEDRAQQQQQSQQTR